MATKTPTKAAETTEDTLTPTKTPANTSDLAFLKMTLAKSSGEQLQINNVFGNHYRVNWRKPKEVGCGLTLLPIVKSRLVRVDHLADGSPKFVELERQ